MFNTLIYVEPFSSMRPSRYEYSTLLRKWLNHDQKKLNEFKSLYYEKLKDKQEIIKLFLEKAKEGTITLLYSAKEEQYNNAIALKESLQFKL